jgi:hypothetical protein
MLYIRFSSVAILQLFKSLMLYNNDDTCYKQIPDSIIIMCCLQKHGLRHITIGGNQYHNYNVTALQQKDYSAIE